MKNQNLNIEQCKVQLSAFERNESKEYHAILCPDKKLSFVEQAKAIEVSIHKLLAEKDCGKEQMVFMRYFLSDFTNQQELIDSEQLFKSSLHKSCAVSFIQEAPLSGAKLQAWVYFVNSSFETKRELKENELRFTQNGYSHAWKSNMSDLANSGNSHVQTELIFSAYMQSLEQQNMNLKDNCIRTWLYVRDVDKKYEGVVVARRELFVDEGLTKDTHFISSTGIEGQTHDLRADVMMDAYAVGGIEQKQVKFLQALEHLNPTHEYGVTFERGTSVDFGDRRHIYISGTASIDKTGAIVHPNEIDKQIVRTFENIQALLSDADAELDDVAKMIVYLRDLSDYEMVEAYFEKHYPHIPKVIVHAPVCRPGWLIEIECIAIKEVENKEWRRF